MSQLNVLDLLHTKEKTYRTIIGVVAVLFWGFVLWALVRALSQVEFMATSVLVALTFYPLFFLFTFWIIGLFFKAMIYGESAKVGPQQYVVIHDMAKSHSERLGLVNMPEIFIHSGSGLINALAIAFLSRKYVLLNAPIVDLMLKRGKEAELSFVIGHELAHHAAGHTNVWRGIFLKPALVIPLLGNAFRRSQELSADRIAMALVGDVNSSQKSLVAIAMGAESLANDTNIDMFIEQELEIPGLMGFIHKIFSTHPRMTRRVIELRLFSREERFQQYEKVSSNNPNASQSLTDSYRSAGEKESNSFPVIALIIAVVIVVAILGSLYMNDNDKSTSEEASQSVVEQMNSDYTEESGSATDQTQSTNNESQIKPLVNNEYTSRSEGAWEKITFRETEAGISIAYTNDIDGTTPERVLRFDETDAALFFVDKPNVRYPISQINERGFYLRNPDGRSQYFELYEEAMH